MRTNRNLVWQDIFMRYASFNRPPHLHSAANPESTTLRADGDDARANSIGFPSFQNPRSVKRPKRPKWRIPQSKSKGYIAQPMRLGLMSLLTSAASGVAGSGAITKKPPSFARRRALILGIDGPGLRRGRILFRLARVDQREADQGDAHRGRRRGQVVTCFSSSLSGVIFGISRCATASVVR
jgi:hypothetical protein